MNKVLRTYAGTLLMSALFLLCVGVTSVALIYRPGSPVLGEFLSGTLFWIINDKGTIESSNTRDRLPPEYRDVAKPGSDGYPTFHPESNPSSFLLMKEISQVPRRYLVVRREGNYLADAFGLQLIYFLPVFLLFGLLFGLMLHAWNGWKQRKLAGVLSRVGQGNLEARFELGPENRQPPAQQGLFVAAKLVERVGESRKIAERSLIHLLENLSGALHPRFEKLRKQLDDRQRVEGLEVFDSLLEDLRLFSEIRSAELTPESESPDLGDLLAEEIGKFQTAGKTIVLNDSGKRVSRHRLDPVFLRVIARKILESASIAAKEKIEITLVRRARETEILVRDDGGESPASLELAANLLRAFVESQGAHLTARRLTATGAELSIVFPSPLATDLREAA